ncbi:hypothetical protein [Anaerorhabdus sp.]|uniref:hypothetical protein n=1 Tax=Anaerorhabdus sp. TaxID=1872524 RepID=UPI002FC95FA3
MKKTAYKVIAPIVCTLLLFGCTTNNNKTVSDYKEDYKFYNAYETISKDDTLFIQSQADMSIDLRDPKVVAANSDSIVIATIQSIDGGDILNKVKGTYCHPYTYGTMIIESTIKGDLESGTEVKYTRMGGIVSFNKYLSSLPTAKRDKLLSQPQASNVQYVDYTFGDDIEIEVGKTYLMYLIDPENSIVDPNAYRITMWQGGMREVRGNNVNSDLRSASLNEIQIYNNFTNEWENLDTILN